MSVAATSGEEAHRSWLRDLQTLALHTVLPVVIGGVIYGAFRSSDHLLFRWAEALGVGGAIAWLRTMSVGIHLPDVFVYSLPDALWLYAFAFGMNEIWHRRKHDTEGTVWRIAPLVLALGSEVAQGLGVLQGTFDWWDVAAYACAHALVVGRAFAIDDTPIAEAAR